MKLLDKLKSIKIISYDKQLHIATGMLLGVILGSYPLIAISAITIAALGKEAYDFIANKIAGKKVHDVEILDAVATIGGGVLGIALSAIISALI